MDGLDLGLHADLAADEEAAGPEGLVPPQPPLHTVDRRARAEAGLRVAPRILRDAEVLDVPGHRLGHALEGEVALHTKTVLTRDLDGRARERGFRVPLDVEEVRTAKVLVAV